MRCPQLPRPVFSDRASGATSAGTKRHFRAFLVRTREVVVRRIGVLAIFLAFAAGPADAAEENGRCVGLLEENDGSANPPELSAQPLLTDNQCEALKNKELRAPLLELPQEDEDPVQLSVGVKNGSGMLRLKIPFSF